MKSNAHNADEVVKQAWSSASPQQVDTARRRALDQFRSRPNALAEGARVPRRFGFRSWTIASAATALAVLALVIAIPISRGGDAYAAVEASDGAILRTSGDRTEVIHAGERVRDGEILTTTQGRGVIALANGSTLEMRAMSELSGTRVTDGVRVRLSKGAAIVDGRKGSGSLSVETGNLIVSGAGGVLLVVAEEKGSRIAVIHGEVLAQQGSLEKTLIAGEQLETSSQMEAMRIENGISWSQNVVTLAALLHQSTATKAPARLEFEVVSIKRELPPPRDQVLSAELTGFSCQGVDGVLRAALGQLPNAAPKGRCLGRMVDLNTLIGFAYDIFPRRVFQAPDWREPGQPLDWGYQIEAKAENPSTATLADLKQMLQSLLEKQFKLRSHFATTECQGYNLVVAATGIKATPASGDEEPPRTTNVSRDKQLVKGKSSIDGFANALTGFVGMPVADRTGLTGAYEYSLSLIRVFVTPLPAGAPGAAPAAASDACGGSNAPRGPRQNRSGETLEVVGYDPPVPRAVEEQLGLRMDRAKVPVRTLIVDHAEKPPEN
jgi:uncharacterized protein (TIGR03435 family)